MAVMSFAHLKKSNDSTAIVNAPKNDLRGDSGDFGQKTIDGITGTQEINIEDKRTCYAIPAIMPTARIARVNLCRGCPRFIQESEAAENNLKKSKAGYGFCLRDSDRGGEEYIAIPAKATVARCYINLMWDR